MAQFNSTVRFGVFLLLASGTAFVAGTSARNYSLHRFTLRPVTQLAQVKSEGGFALQQIADTARSSERRVDNELEDARRTFDTVHSLVRQHFVEKLPPEETMSRSAVRAMIASLNDPNCFFLEPEQFALLDGESRGRFSGIGAALFVRGIKRDGFTENKIVVVAPLPGSPAERAGLKSGDIITHIDGKWILSYDPFLKANRLIGKTRSRDSRTQATLRQEWETARTRVRDGINLLAAQLALRGDARTVQQLKLPTTGRVLTVERPGVARPLTFTVTPGVTEVAPVVCSPTNENTAHLKISLFTPETPQAVKTALQRLPDVSGLILDLRGNPGGSMAAAIEVNALLAPDSPFGMELVAGGKRNILKSSGHYNSAKRPIVILVDKGTASVAEALAASLADKGIATIMGGRTFGDASVQMAFTLPDGSAFVLNTGQLLGPQGSSWASSGLAPKVALDSSVSDGEVLEQAAHLLEERVRVAVSPRSVGKQP